MKTITLTRSTLIVLGLVAATACSNGAPPGAGSAEDPKATAAAATQASSLDETLADVDTGKDPARSRAALEAVLADPQTAKEDRIRADAALARLVQDTDHERATALLEDAVTLGDADAQKKLFTLLAGHEPPSPWRHHDDTPFAPSAKALAKYFPAATPDRKVEVSITVFGDQHDHATQNLGTFEISAALRQNAIDACGICDEVKTDIHTSRTGTRLWSAIPQYAAQMEKALVVIYVDEQTMVPARYEKWLAAPAADVQAALARGDGLFAVKERDGAPPLVTIAAPRAPQLALVETRFADSRELPKQPVTVKLAAGLSKDEVRAAVRDRFGAFRGCFDAYTKRRPGGDVAGNANLSYTILANGALGDVRLGLDPSLEEPELRACMEKVAGSLRYPAWSKDASDKTTVRYPIHFASNEP